MKIIRGFDQIYPDIKYPVLTIGNFDGVHLGHQDLVRTVIRRAGKNGGKTMVLSFEPHPLRILAPEKAPLQIQTLDQRLNSLHALGLDFVWIIPFSKQIALISARDFVRDILVGRLGTREVCVGKHFFFGRNRQGTIQLLQELGPELGFSVLEVEELRFRGFRISSTGIRQFLLDGRVSLAARILGRPATLKGCVVVGSKRGRKLGFPTANIKVENELIPKNGVYITMTIWRGQTYHSLTNIGYRPTMHDSALTQARPIVETHILNFSDDLYGEEVELQFLYRLRDEERFASVEQLEAQISRDKRRAIRYLSHFGQHEFQEMEA